MMVSNKMMMKFQGSPTRSASTAILSLLICNALTVESVAIQNEGSWLTRATESTARNAQTENHRRLQNYNNNNNYYGNANSYAYDLSGFSVHYDKCQYVRTYDDDLAADEDSDSPLAMKHFVLFRLCPTEECQVCDESENFGRYTTDVDTYLTYTVEQQKQIFENMCDNCDEECGEGQECYSYCGQLCYQYGNMEDNGLVDASEYVQCQQFQVPDEDDENRRRLTQQMRTKRRQRRRMEDQGGEEEEAEEEEDDLIYIGPKCSDSGKKIELALFADENCWDPIEDVSVDSFMQGELSYFFLEHTYHAQGDVCLKCAESNQNQNENDKEDADDVSEMCENLYDAAAKCETPNGITAGFIQTNRDDGQYENQVETEFLSCAFINSLVWNSYTETGEIDHVNAQDVYVRHVTAPQAIALGLLSVWFLGLLGLMAHFQKKIGELKGSKVGLEVDSRAIWA